MRWYVNVKGQTVGPFEESGVIAMGKRGELEKSTVRDEAGGAWMPVEQSPFKSYVKVRSLVAPIVCGLIVAFAGVGIFGPLGAAGGVLTFLALWGVRQL